MTGEYSRQDLQEGQGEMLCPILLEVIMGEHKGKIERYKKYREYKEQGHSLKEVTEHFGISHATALNACKGIAPQKAKVNTSNRKNQYTCQSFDREQNAIRTIEERTPGFEYAGGFTHCDGRVMLRCRRCGHVQSRSMISVRKQAVECENCRAEMAEERARAKETAKEQRQTQRRENVINNRVQKETDFFVNTMLVECEECGTIFATRKQRQRCCSAECSRKRNNRLSSHRKDARISLDKRIDKDITVKKLFQRDRGVCWVCGKRCDIKDYTEQNGTIICGNQYPSIDHVVPVCDGGEDSWDNVRLAHRICNTKRYWGNFASPGSYRPTP